ISSCARMSPSQNTIDPLLKALRDRRLCQSAVEKSAFSDADRLFREGKERMHIHTSHTHTHTRLTQAPAHTHSDTHTHPHTHTLLFPPLTSSPWIKPISSYTLVPALFSSFTPVKGLSTAHSSS